MTDSDLESSIIERQRLAIEYIYTVYASQSTYPTLGAWIDALSEAILTAWSSSTMTGTTER